MDGSILSKLKEYFARRSEVKMAFLFGSHAKGRGMGESDVDVAIWLDQPNDMLANQIWSDLEDILRREVDLIVLNNASATVAWAAMRGTHLLIRDEQLFIDLMLDRSAEAEDFDDFVNDFWGWRERLRSGA